MMSTKRNFRVRVITNYQAPFPDPIQARHGDTVTIDLNKQTNISGWVWCTNSTGKSGWVPESYIDIQESSGKMICDYDAIELTVAAGDLLTVHKAESAFYWVTDEKGKQGWVPVAHVEPYENKDDLEKKRNEHREAL